MTFFLDISDFDPELFEKAALCEEIILPQRLFQSSKNHSVVSRVLLGLLLKKEKGIEDFSLDYGKNLKPFLKEYPRVHFNISHSADYIICSLCEREIGCDVQVIGEFKERIARRYFTEKENELLKKSSEPAEDFTRLWALKESILKKEGTGVSGGLSTYCFAENLRDDFFKAYGYYFSVFPLSDAVIAVCSEKGQEKIINITKKEIESYIESVVKGDRL